MTPLLVQLSRPLSQRHPRPLRGPVGEKRKDGKNNISSNDDIYYRRYIHLFFHSSYSRVLCFKILPISFWLHSNICRIFFVGGGERQEGWARFFLPAINNLLALLRHKIFFNTGFVRNIFKLLFCLHS